MRAPYVTPVLLVPRRQRPIDARSEEISEEGMLVVSPLPSRSGRALTLRFASPVTGRDARRSTRPCAGRARAAAGARMGLEFEGVPPEVRQAVVDYIGSLPVGVG